MKTSNADPRTVAVGMSDDEIKNMEWYIEYMLGEGMTADQIEFFLKAN